MLKKEHSLTHSSWPDTKNQTKIPKKKKKKKTYSPTSLINIDAKILSKILANQDFPGHPVIKNPPCNARDIGSIPAQKTGISDVVGQPRPCATMKTQHSQINKYLKKKN